MKQRILKASLTLLLVVCPVWAIFGVGDIVHDPISYANALLMLGELVKSYEQLRAEYELLLANLRTVPVDMATRYRTFGAAWYGLQLPADRFGNLQGWIEAVNKGNGALGGYNDASVVLQQYGPTLARLPLEEQRRLTSEYAALELGDGTNVQSMEVLGMLRASAAANDRTIQSLSADSFSLDPTMNTEIAVLNKLNAAAVANLNGTRDTNRTLLSVLEQQLTESKSRRDADVTSVNAAIKRLEEGSSVTDAYTSTLSQSLENFRWE